MISEIGYLNRHSTLNGRLLCQLCQTRPLGGIIHVHVERQTIVQAINQARVHGIVHLVGNTKRMALLPEQSCRLCGIALHGVECLSPSQWLTLCPQQGGEGLFQHKAFRPTNGLQAIVRTGGGDIELQHDTHTIACLYQSSVDAPHDISLIALESPLCRNRHK